ncbi:hypothetical protein [Deinococcus aquaedulcis]|uniref:hypothetical protein n=1 Tax=Deinococcus aquaedulcis TaxID=2840455 RepID=UPI001C82DE33|nr:hypothetical protein [Deinococcus aquaedulcis]
MKVRFWDGVEAWLDHLDLRYTYAGLVEGRVCTQLNTWILEQAAQNAHLVLAPTITPGPPAQLSPEQVRLEALPSVQAQAQFKAHAARSAVDGVGSVSAVLRLVWWQDEMPDHLSSCLRTVAGTVNWWSGAEEVDPVLTPGW